MQVTGPISAKTQGWCRFLVKIFQYNTTYISTQLHSDTRHGPGSKWGQECLNKYRCLVCEVLTIRSWRHVVAANVTSLDKDKETSWSRSALRDMRPAAVCSANVNQVQYHLHHRPPHWKFRYFSHVRSKVCRLWLDCRWCQALAAVRGKCLHKQLHLPTGQWPVVCRELPAAGHRGLVRNAATTLQPDPGSAGLGTI